MMSRRIVVVLCLLGFWIYAVHMVLQAGDTTRRDFPQFYAAARMIREGQAARLYDLAAQAEFQTRYYGSPPARPGIPDVPFLSPAATALIFLPLAWMPYGVAYGIWTGLNLCLLALAARMLERNLRLTPSYRILLWALFLAPVTVTFVNRSEERRVGKECRSRWS